MKTIDAVLLAHKAQPATTLWLGLVVGPLADDSYRCFTDGDIDIDFQMSGGIGLQTFHSATAMEASTLVQSADGSVDNGEASALQPLPGFELIGVTQTQIDAGALDGVKFRLIEFNFEDLTAGRCEIVAGGTIGEMRRKIGRLTVFELRSLKQQLKQFNMIGLTSIACPARFGSQPPGTGSGAPEEELYCGFDATTLWVTGTITSVGAETGFQFADSALLSDTPNQYAPGMVEFTSGDNAGQQIEVDTYDNTSGVVELLFETFSAMKVGDNFKIRERCSKQWTGHNSCETFWGDEKALHHRGFPGLPVGQAAALTVPGVSIPGSAGGTVGASGAAE